MKTANLARSYRLAVQRQHQQVASNIATGTGTEEFLSPREAADFLRISYKRLLNMSSNGQIPYHKLGRSNRYLKSELINMLLQSKKGLTA